MAVSRNLAIIAVAILVSVLLAASVLIFIYVVVPNLTEVDVSVSGKSQNNNTDDKVQETISTEHSTLLILGLIFASVLIVLLIVVIIIALVLAKKSEGYVVGSDGLEQNLTYSAGNEVCQLTRHKNNRNIPINTIGGNLTCTKNLSSSTKSLSTLYGPDYSSLEKKSSSSTTEVVGCIEKNRPQSYGTLSRSRLMTSVDEDGYHVDIDNFSFDYDSIDYSKKTPLDKGASMLDADIRTSLKKLEEDLTGSPLSSPVSSPETVNSPKRRPLKKQLTKQDTFEELPPFKSFDDYLSIVRIDSLSAFDSPTLDQARAQWESIEEEKEKESEKKTSNKTDY